jgi:F420-non-reducing hydrogenase large subunit
MRHEIEAVARANVDFALFALQLFDQVVLGNQEHAALMVSEDFTDHTHSMGTVDEDNFVTFYDGKIRVVDPDGAELLRYHPADYHLHIAEHVEPWTYLKFPYLKKVGWKGLVEGADSGVYIASPLARLNAADGMATPRANEFYEKMYETLGSGRSNGSYRPVHNRLATHWARLIELLYAAERMVELATDVDVTQPDLRVTAELGAGQGVGSVEAPRGTLTHHYWTDEQGLLTRVNLIVGTTNNHAPMAMSITKAARALIAPGRDIDDGLLNRIEMVIRSYDPCLSCATHTYPGDMPLSVTIRSADGEIVHRLR